MVSRPESQNPDSDGVRSACVPKFRKRDGMMAAASKNWEKVLDFLSLDRRGLQGEGLDRRSRAVRRCIRLRGGLSFTNRFSA